MKINEKKTKIMLINMAKKYAFPPEVSFEDGKNLECISEMKLVGVVISSDLKWAKNTNYICKKAMKKMWIIRRLKNIDFNMISLVDIYTKEIRSHLELAVPVWHSGLTKMQEAQIERIQKTALFLILGERYLSYAEACSLCELDTLKERREKLCLKFAKKDVQREQSLFRKASKMYKTKNKSPIVTEYNCKKARFEKSSLPYLAKLLNRNT